ncbi:MAG TPA: hypothetical protein VHZ99_03945 [Steroidobacteraceae bacterium]|jgi:hypothetical protein|nr:hypothetical protein [Steroidobacteraceae bacterium]
MSDERTERADRTEELPQVPEAARVRPPAAQSPVASVNPPSVNPPSVNPLSAKPPAANSPSAYQAAPNPAKEAGPEAKKAPETPPKQVAQAKLEMRERLPALEDDADVGVEKNQIVTRDGKPDLAFNGVLVASAAPEHTVEDHWWEYRIYRTQGGKHVFSKIDRTIYEGEDDAYTAEVFDPSPSSVPSQLLRSARELARSRPVTWQEAAAAFYGYGPIAKALYRKLDSSFEEQIE